MKQPGSRDEQVISRVIDILQLQTIEATYSEIVDTYTHDGGTAAARFGELLITEI